MTWPWTSMNRSMELENSALGRQSQPRRDRKLEYRRRQIQRAEPPSAGSRSPKSEQPAKSAMPGASPLPSPLFEPGTSGSDQHHASPRSSKYYDIEHTPSDATYHHVQRHDSQARAPSYFVDRVPNLRADTLFRKASQLAELGPEIYVAIRYGGRFVVYNSNGETWAPPEPHYRDEVTLVDYKRHD